MSKLEAIKAEILTLSREDAEKLLDWLSVYLESDNLKSD